MTLVKIAVIYSTVDGQTLKICQKIAEHLQFLEIESRLLSIKSAEKLEQYDGILLGASIRYGKHHSRVTQFISQNLKLLNEIPSAFFSVNLVARKPEKRSAETNPYVKKFLAQIAWKPELVGVFGGKLYYPKYRWSDRLIIRLIMKITHGPTQTPQPIEYTDWKQVKYVALEFGEMVKREKNEAVNR